MFLNDSKSFNLHFFAVKSYYGNNTRSNYQQSPNLERGCNANYICNTAKYYQR